MTRRAMRAATIGVALLVGAAGLGVVGPSAPAQAEAPYYSPSATEGSIYRLYRAYFLREPDVAGFAYWFVKVAKGTSLDGVSEAFARSSEFRNRYGALDDGDFVDLVYENVLGRSADPGGRDHWIGRLEAGISRGRVMRSFSESSEYRRHTVAGVPSGWRAGANARTVLAGLPVAAEQSRSGYSAGLFPHWDDTDHDGCNTRCEVLANEKRRDGTWFSWWDAKLVSVSGYLDLDHVVDPAEAWDSGAAGWDSAERDAFADWQVNLVAVGKKVNAAKGDRDAATWAPPRAKSNCLFAEITITTKQHWGLSVDPDEKAALSHLLDGCGRTTSASPPVTGPPTSPPTVLLYGDSLSVETAAYFRYFMNDAGARGVTVVYGGAAPCDWFAHMRRDLTDYRPVAVVMQFSGAAVTTCMQNREYYGAYRQDTRTATHIFTDAGIPVVWVSSPRPQSDSAAAVLVQIHQIEQDTATELGQTFVDAGAVVLDHGAYTKTLPCLSHESSQDGCSGGRIVVRAPDGAHFCPTQTSPCSVYSSGALRYGAAQAEAGLRRTGIRSLVPDKPLAETLE